MEGWGIVECGDIKAGLLTCSCGGGETKLLLDSVCVGHRCDAALVDIISGKMNKIF